MESFPLEGDSIVCVQESSAQLRYRIVQIMINLMGKQTFCFGGLNPLKLLLNFRSPLEGKCCSIIRS